MPKTNVNHLRIAPYGVNVKDNTTCLVERAYGVPGEQVSDYIYPNITWEDNLLFEATMEFIPGETFRVHDIVTMREYTMFASEVARCIIADTICNSRISGMWKAVKHGNSYGIELVI